MSNIVKETPWKNGFWYNKTSKCFLVSIEGENAEMKNIVCLDYPGKGPCTNHVDRFSGFWPMPPFMDTFIK